MSERPPAPPTQVRKSHPPEFQAVWDGTKTFDYRQYGPGLLPGDWFTQEEYDPEGDYYTGRTITHEVAYVLGGDRAKEFGLPQFAEIVGLGRVVKRFEPRRHVLVVPDDPSGRFQIEHYGCPSTVRIYQLGDPVIDRGYEGAKIESPEDLVEDFPYATVHGLAVTEHDCKVTEYLFEHGFDWSFAHPAAVLGEIRDSYVTRVTPGRHDIVYRERFDPPCEEYEGDYEDWLEVMP